MKKRIITCLLSVILILSLVPVMAQGDEYANEPVFDTEVNFLKTIGVTEEGFEPYFQMTRAEFIKLIAKVMYNRVNFDTQTVYGESVFKDVDTGRVDYPYLKACYDLNIIKGDNAGCFRPDDFITFNEAVAVIINALGYTLYADAAGSYPAGYISVASNTGILQSISPADAPTGYVLCKMLYNALFADLVTIDSVSGGNISVSTKPDSNILSARLGIEEYDAKIVDNGYVSITGSASIGDDERIILENMKDGSRNIVYAGNTDIKKHIGSRVKAFVKIDNESGKNEVIYYAVHKRNNEVLLNAEDIVSMDINEIQYEEPDNSNGKIRRLSFVSGGPLMMFNGSHVTGNISTYIPEDGFVKAYDYESDGRFDFINIISFNVRAQDNGAYQLNQPARNIVVGNTYPEEEYISCKFYPLNSLKLEDQNYIFILNDDVASFADLKAGDIISVAQSYEKINGKFYYQLAVMRKSVSGKITSVSSVDETLELNSKEYKISSGLKSIKSGFLNYIDYNTDYTFSLDVTGKIAYSKSLVSNDKNYAYLIKANIRYTPDEELIAKFLTKNGEIKEYVFAESVVVDGDRKNTPSDIFTALKKREGASNPSLIGAPSDLYNTEYHRPVILKINSSGKISEIDTDNLNYPVTNEFTYYSSETIIPYSKTEVEDAKALKAGYRSPRIEELTRFTNSLSGRFYITDETLVLCVPEIDVYALDKFSLYASNKVDSGFNQPFKYNMIKLYEKEDEDSNYKVTTGSSLDIYHGYDIQGYDIDPDTGVAGLVVLRGSNSPYVYGNVPYDTTYPMQVYLRKTKVYDESKEKNVTKIYYTTDGVKEESAIIDIDDALYAYRYLIEGSQASDTPYNMAYKALKKGDIIRVIKSGQELTHIERVYHIDTIDSALSSALYPSFPRVMYSDNLAGVVNLPSDERGYYAGFMSGYYLGAVYPKSISGVNLTCLMGKKFVSDTDITSPSSYNVQSINVTDTTYVLIEMDSSGVKDVREGSVGDIKTIDEYGIDDASILLYHDLYHQINKIIIINRV